MPTARLLTTGGRTYLALDANLVVDRFPRPGQAPLEDVVRRHLETRIRASQGQQQRRRTADARSAGVLID